MQQEKKRMTKGRKAAAAPSTVIGNAVALSISAMMLASTAAAQDAPDEEQVELDTVQIQDRTIDTNPYAEPGAPYKARLSGDPRRLKEIADTPTTMSVLTQTQIEDSGKSDLREILSAQPGITLGTGEGGNAFGDRYIIRGHEARSDVFVDGLRDPGMTIRESFALEQVEITKGPSSTFAGRGSTGGAINGITKQADSEYDFVKFQGGPGTDEYYRVHLDVNKRLSDDLAVRGNLLYADEEVPDRAPAERLRRGAALSVGAVVTYQSAMFTGQPDAAAGFDADAGKYTYEVPGYTTLDLFANYKITERIGLRLNVGNVTDEDYYLAGYRSGSFVYLGDARNAKLALTYSF